MMRWVIEACLRFRFLVLSFALIIVFIGLVRLHNMPVDVLPEFAPPYIEVQTEAPGLSSPEVEELVTFNLEELLNGTPWLQSITSTSVPGLSSIRLIFESGTDIIRARQLVSERLSLAYALPNVAQSPVILQPLSAMSQVMMVGLYSQKVSSIEMSVLAHWNIRPALLSVPGVANVAIWGLRDKQFQVQVNPNQLQSNNVKLDQIISTTGNALWVSPLSFLNASTPGSGGWIETPQQRLEVRHVLPITSPTDLAKINIEDTQLALGNMAQLTEGHQPLIGDDVVNNGPGLLIVIEKFPGANTLEVTRNIEAKLAELQPGLTGIQIDSTIFRPANFVDTSINNIGFMLFLGFLLLAFVILILMYSFRAMLMSIVIIPISLMVALLVLSLQGSAMNSMILAGLLIAIAIIVDDVIIDVTTIIEALHRERDSDQSTATIILNALLKTRSAMLYATLILLLSILPIFFLEGEARAFFQPLAIAYALALVASIVVALTVTPLLCVIFLNNKFSIHRHVSPLFLWLQHIYMDFIEWIMRVLPALFVFLSAIILSVLTLVGLIFLLTKALPLLPEFKDHNVTIQWEGPPGTSAVEMVRITTLASRRLRAIPGVVNVAAHIGRAVLGNQIVDVNSAKLMVSINPEGNYHQTMVDIEKVIAAYPGMFHVVQTYLKERVRLVRTGSNADLIVRVFGHEMDLLQKKAEEVKQVLSSIQGVTDIHVEQPMVEPQLAIEVDLAKAQQYGLKPGDVRRAAATMVAGLEAGSLFQAQKIFPVIVWSVPMVRHSMNSLRDLLIATPSGQWVRLSDVASVTIVPTPTLIKHEAVSRRMDVSLNVHGRNLMTVEQEIKERLQKIKFPLEFRAELVSGYQEQHVVSLMIVAIIGLIAIFLLLQAAFESFGLAAVVLLTLPSALLGGVIAAFIVDGLSIASLLGLLAVFGIASRNTIVFIKRCQDLERSEKEESRFFHILRAAKEQFTPVLLTTLAVGFVLLPIAIFTDGPGLEIVSPMARIILSGLITSALFIILIVPSLYLRFGADTVHKTKLSDDTNEMF